MKNLFMFFLATAVILYCNAGLSASDEASAVKDVIRKAYFNGAFNEQDTESMERGFHPDFAIFSADGKELRKYPISEWISNIEEKKKDPGFDPDRVRLDCRIVSTDVTGDAAAAKVEISRGGDLLFTDYLSLLKFDDGWKIVAKVYHRN
ncbi:MAG: nuclear transport factor 2 family protein [Candidatus Krumholzibacteriales bacterium]